MPARAGLAVGIVGTGTANLASVVAGLRRAGANPFMVDAPADVETAEHLVLPGVGAFGAAMAFLAGRGLVNPLRRRLASERPTLAICLGMQLLGEGSDESPGVEGLGVFPRRALRLQGPVRVPQLGWNEVVPVDPSIVSRGYAYFANSYCLFELPDGWSGAWSDHGRPFVAAVERKAVLGCQFHPELSGAWGISLIRRWIEGSQSSC